MREMHALGRLMEEHGQLRDRIAEVHPGLGIEEASRRALALINTSAWALGELKPYQTLGDSALKRHAGQPPLQWREPDTNIVLRLDIRRLPPEQKYPVWEWRVLITFPDLELPQPYVLRVSGAALPPVTFPEDVPVPVPEGLSTSHISTLEKPRRRRRGEPPEWRGSTYRQAGNEHRGKTVYPNSKKKKPAAPPEESPQ
jgi:hypothetical protein